MPAEHEWRNTQGDGPHGLTGLTAVHEVHRVHDPSLRAVDVTAHNPATAAVKAAETPPDALPIPFCAVLHKNEPLAATFVRPIERTT
jgi:hypothetical protein